jgi:acyl-CoA synthetase (AMP-forming)/AMP-acid ligase II
MNRTLIDDLREAATGDAGIHFIDSAERESFLPYRELWHSALCALSTLRAAGLREGDALVLQFVNVRQLLVAYWACLAGRIVPVPLTFADPSGHADKLFAVWRTLERPWLATDADGFCVRLRALAQQPDDHATCAAMQARLLRLPMQTECAEPAAVRPDDIAFIQFSSGSTGAPKGVMLTHANLLSNIGDILASAEVTPRDMFLSWKPITHDFGMIAFHLAPIVARCSQVRLATDAFVWNPALWLAATHRHRASILGSPNFGYRHFLKLWQRGEARQFDWDLSCVRAIMNGGEPIDAQLCADFVRELVPYGLRENAMRAGYGLAEGSLVCSLTPLGEAMHSITVDRRSLGIGDPLLELPVGDPHAATFVDCGVPCPNTAMRITDARRGPLPPGRVGRIEIRGASVSCGYYRNPEANRELIDADGWLDTQDLGVLRAGRLFVVGRVKEMITIDGVHYFPHDIEQAILRRLGQNELNKFIVCGRSNAASGRDELVVFVYFKRGEAAFRRLAEQVRQAVLASFGLDVAHVAPVRRVPKTTSGKVQRFKLLAQHPPDAAHLPGVADVEPRPVNLGP